MKNKFVYFAVFAVGALVGSAASMHYFKKKYEQIAQEEIDSVKETFKLNKEKETDILKEESEKEAQEQKDKGIMKEIISKTNYTSFYKDEEDAEEEVEKMKNEKPYVISPESVGEDDYDVVTFTYYANDILTNEQDEVIEGKELETLIGSDSLTHFGEYEEDCVYVRNDKLKTDFEILRDIMPYSDDDE